MSIPEDIESLMDDANSVYYMGGCASQEDYDTAMGMFDGPDDDYYDDDYCDDESW